MGKINVPARTKNAIEARIEATVKKYGLEHTRTIWGRWSLRTSNRLALERQIEKQKAELEELKKKAK